MAESQLELPEKHLLNGAWPRALAWGFGVALVHRVLLGIWLAVIWTILSQFTHASINFHDPHGLLPPLATTADQLIFGVWRRWDVIHYLDLALHGYQLSNPGPTVFGPLAPFAFRAADLLLPGGIDLAAMIVQTLAFGAALTFLYRLVETWFEDEKLGQWSVIVMALLPMSYLFAAPMSESVYLAAVLGLFYFGLKDRWLLASICGLLATLARSQGAILIVMAALLLVERQPAGPWRSRLMDLCRRGWILILIPIGAFTFTLYRDRLGLPPVNQVYADFSYVFFVNPLEGLWINLRWMLNDLPGSLLNIDAMTILITFALTVLLARSKRLRRPSIIAYVALFLLIFLSKINWMYGTHVVMATQSFARYTVVLWPFAVLIASGLIQAKPITRVIGVTLLCFGLLAFSGLFVMALSGP